MIEIEKIEHEYKKAVGYEGANLDKLMLIVGTGQWSVVYDNGSVEVVDYGDTDMVAERLIRALGVDQDYTFEDRDWSPDGQHVVSLAHARQGRILRFEALKLADEIEADIKGMQKTADELRSQHGG